MFRKPELMSTTAIPPGHYLYYFTRKWNRIIWKCFPTGYNIKNALLIFKTSYEQNEGEVQQQPTSYHHQI